MLIYEVVISTTFSSSFLTIPTELSTTAFGHNSKINSTARARAAFCILGSIPFSNLAEESLLNPWAAEVRRTDVGLKYADSKIIFLVSSLTSVFLPPITPPRAIARVPSVITKSVVCNFLSSPSRVSRTSPSLASRTTILSPTRSLSNACIGCPNSNST